MFNFKQLNTSRPVAAFVKLQYSIFEYTLLSWYVEMDSRMCTSNDALVAGFAADVCRSCCWPN